MSGIATELVARQLDLPTVLTFHGLGAHGLRRRMESKLARAVHVGLGELYRRGVRTDSDGPPTLVHLRDSVSKAFTPNGPQAARSGEHRVVGVGKILPGNGFDALVRALPLIPAAEFVIIGEAERGDQQSDREARRLRGLAERLGSPTGYACTRTPPSPKSRSCCGPPMWSRVDPDVRTVRCRRTGSNGLRRPGGGLRG